MMTFKELRERSGMTRTQFAEYFGIPYRTVQAWELHGESKESRKCPEYLLRLMEYKLKHEEMVRCNNCEYGNQFGECSHPTLCSDDSQAFLQVSDNGFCSYGKRKDDI